MASSHQKTARQKRDVVEVIITDDLASALEEIRYLDEPNLDDCYSVNDVCEKLGETKSNARDIIKDCIENGTCEYAGKRRETAIDRRVVKIPVYRFKFKNKREVRKKR